MVARSLRSRDSPQNSLPDTGNHLLNASRAETLASEEKGMENGKSEGLPGRRTSRRIQDKQRAEKQLVQKRVQVVGDDGGSKKKRATERSRGKQSPKKDDAAIGLAGSEVLESRDREESEEGGSLKAESSGGENRVVEQGNAANLVETGPHAKVKKTLRLFNKYYLHLIQDEEMRCKKAEADKKSKTKAKKRKSKDKVVAEDIVKAKAKRPDLKAISKMLEAGEILHPKKMIGNLPGIEVGHQFYSRAEMVAVGFHSHWLNGIDYMGQSYKKQYSSHTFPVAVSIVLSGMYEDDLDNADEVVYTGQGGHNLTGDKRQVRDQELSRGNMALKNSMEQDVPVRVTRGHESSSSYSGKVYTYDGLYKVIS
ncbi:histone-lysine N-methyltransferase, H3 lysine-9 specific SUVH4 isoform X1 [Carica papaya]|uniref:histone-lysine N-methyltransferase, H3 lysine-9 specific SUVH4 isoform X1 n=1 Tax=Carica papaya TaxID=3649 RepID=UPI000B8CF54F|nr:histone-lysine N-methyltransferase, H3 lysine-9 specific SUVH4 isoform X1 [Carica papaya]